MKNILGLIGIIVIFGGAYYFFIKKPGVSVWNSLTGLVSSSHNNQPLLTSPLEVFNKVKGLAPADQISTLSATLGGWAHNAQFPISYPKNWRSTTVTLEKTTFKVLTADSQTPPTFYISFEFPRALTKKVTVVKCLGLDPKSATDWCVVGNNDQMNAYFQMISLIKNNSPLNPQNALQMIEGMTPKVNF